jgi:hypothetical protein
VLLEPVQLRAAPGANLPASDQKMLTGYFYNALKEDLSKNFTMTEEPGPDTLLVRVALNDATGAVPVLRSISVIIPQARVQFRPVPRDGLLRLRGRRRGPATWSMIGTGTDRGTDAASPSLAIGATPGTRQGRGLPHSRRP